MISVVPYKQGMLDDWIYNGVEREYSGKNIHEIVDFYARLGDVWVGYDEWRIVGVGGIYPLWNNTISCWLFVNKEIKEQKVSFFRAVLSLIDESVKKYRANKIMVDCANGILSAESLIKHLGFEKSKEIRMIQYVRRG